MNATSYGRRVLLIAESALQRQTPKIRSSYIFWRRAYSLRSRHRVEPCHSADTGATKSHELLIFPADAQKSFGKPELARTWFVARAMRPCPVALVVSADRQVRQIIIASLDELGCTTLDASSDQEGLQFAAMTRVDCVIVDACPPETLVSNMIRQLRLLQPEIKVLYLVDRTGFVPGPWSALRRSDACLNKPFELGELRTIVESWMDDRLSFGNSPRMSLN